MVSLFMAMFRVVLAVFYLRMIVLMWWFCIQYDASHVTLESYPIAVLYWSRTYLKQGLVGSGFILHNIILTAWFRLRCSFLFVWDVMFQFVIVRQLDSWFLVLCSLFNSRDDPGYRRTIPVLTRPRELKDRPYNVQTHACMTVSMKSSSQWAKSQSKPI